MECAKCKSSISVGEEREHNKKILCEDCYIDVLTPAKFCDPWADYAAKSFVEKNPSAELNTNQKHIIDVLKKHGKVDPLFLMETLKDQMSPEDGERECAALKRMDRILIENNNGKVIIKLK
jgi:hypothetical protein